MFGGSVSAIAIAVASVVVIAGGATAFYVYEMSIIDEEISVSPAVGLIYDGSEQQLLIVSGDLRDATFKINGSETPGIPTAKDSGNYTVSYHYLADDFGFVKEGSYEVTISKKAVTVSASNLEKEYTESDPQMSASVSGVAQGDSVSYSVYRDAGEDVGQYQVHVTGESNQGNYNVSFKDGTFTINRKSVTVSAEGLTKEYGTKDPELKATVTGLVGSDTISYDLSRAPGEDVGGYEITVTGQTVQGNYDVSFVN